VPLLWTPLLPLGDRCGWVGSWSVGRDGAWGLPLPVWAVTAAARVCVGGLADLSGSCEPGSGHLDPSPRVDRLVFPASSVEETMRRLSLCGCALEAAVLPGLVPEPARRTWPSAWVTEMAGWRPDEMAVCSVIAGLGQAVTLPEAELRRRGTQRSPPRPMRSAGVYTG